MRKKLFLFVLSVAIAGGLLGCKSTQDIETKSVDEALVAPIIMKAEGKYVNGTKPFQGIPTIATSASGKRQFLAWYGNMKTEMSGNYIMLSYGDKNNWQNKVDVIIKSQHDDSVRLFDPCLWRSPSGDIWLFWAQSKGTYRFDKNQEVDPENKYGQYDRRGGVWYAICKNPDDENPQWTAPKRLCNGVLLNKPIALKNGKWAFPVSEFYISAINDLKSLEEGAKLYVSDTDAKNFELINSIRIPYAPYPEHMFVEKKNGELWLLSRKQQEFQLELVWEKGKKRYTFGNSGILEAFSSDGGKTFGKLRPSPITHPDSRFFIYRLKSGNLILVKNYADDEKWLSGKPRDASNIRWYKREKIVVYLSKDDGKTWQGGLVLDGRQNVSYPDADEDSNGNIYVCYDYERYKHQEIYVAKITEADILNKKITSPSEPAKIANKAK